MKVFMLVIALASITFVAQANTQQFFENESHPSFQNDQQVLHRYDVKSGIIDYTITTSGKVMMSNVNGNGKAHLYFKDWGAIELQEEESSQTTTMKVFGREKTETEEKHIISKLDNGRQWSVDFKNQTIFESRSQAMDYMKQTNTNATDAGRSMLESMGGKMVGNESIQGYTCEVWEIAGGKQWIYKGVLIKLEMTVLGIKTSQEATNVRFDIAVDDHYFELPDFPVQKIDQTNQDDMMNASDYDDMEESMQYIRNLSFEEWKAMVIKEDPEMKEKSDAELRQSYDILQKMAGKK